MKKVTNHTPISAWIYGAILVLFLVLIASIIATNFFHYYNEKKLYSQWDDYISKLPAHNTKDSISAVYPTVPLTKADAITDPNSTYGLILAGIALVFAMVVVVPKVLIKQEIEEEIKRSEIDLKKKLRATYEESLATHANTIDAHVSRMIAYFLKGNSDDIKENIWAIGWGCRSIKNYIRIYAKDNVLGEPVNMDNYGNLISTSIKIINDAYDNIFKSAYKKTIINANEFNYSEHFLIPQNHFSKVGIGNISAAAMGGIMNELETNDAYSIAARTCKDMFDVFFLIYLEQTGQNKKTFNKHRSNFKELETVSPIVTMLVCILLEKERQNDSEGKNDRIDYVNNILKKITSQSNFYDNNEYEILSKRFINNCQNTFVENSKTGQIKIHKVFENNIN